MYTGFSELMHTSFNIILEIFLMGFKVNDTDNPELTFHEKLFLEFISKPTDLNREIQAVAKDPILSGEFLTEFKEVLNRRPAFEEAFMVEHLDYFCDLFGFEKTMRILGGVEYQMGIDPYEE